MTAIAAASGQDPTAFVTEIGGRRALDLVVRNANCGACLMKIETGIGRLQGVEAARLNLSTGRLHVEWRGSLTAREITGTLEKLGYPASAIDIRQAEGSESKTEKRLLTAMAVAGLSAAGVMFFSEPAWFGADLDAGSLAMLRWLSAIIAIPASAYSGWTFFSSAGASLAHGRLNMDVPISLAVILSLALSLFTTATGGAHTFFDASVMLLFFLLIGRFLDARLRRRAYAAANALSSMQASTVTRLGPAGAETVRAADVHPGDRLLIAAGEKLAVDAELTKGRSQADLRLVTGEVEPAATYAGQVLYAGSVNLTAPIEVRAIAPASRSLMADIARMLEAGEQKKSAYRRIADRAVAIYVPQVHLLALLGFAGWLFAGASLTQAAYVAVTVLIITCPCALALAAPLVQVVAAGRLFRDGSFLTSGDALERLAEVDHVVFDKTGTLTLGDPVLVMDEVRRPETLAMAAQLARASRHPFSRALAMAAGPGPVADGVEERAGEGVQGRIGGRPARLGTAAFAGAHAEGSGLWFAIEGGETVRFSFEDALRPDTEEAILQLRGMGLSIELISGDTEERVAAVASVAGISKTTARATPQMKAQRLRELDQAGRKVLMVGDGLNDAGAMALAHASLAPGGAVDVSRLASDCVFSGDSLGSVVRILQVARQARSRMRENFAMALLYNFIAIPIALIGWATPLVAAAAMSASSAVVTLNALRLAVGSKEEVAP